jgi:formylglycine-generating enzyme required for sulfatase activity
MFILFISLLTLGILSIAKERHEPIKKLESKESFSLKAESDKNSITQQDKDLGVAEITPRKEYPEYVMPAMVKLIPRETILGVIKGEGSNLANQITFIFPYAPRGSDTTRTVKLDPYCIGQYEVTLYEFEKFLNDTGKAKKDILIDGDKQVKPNRPVVGIYRKDAIEYCEWLSKKTGMKFRLPTEDEWEYAARSGYEQKPTPYGDEMPFKYKKHPEYKGGLVFPLSQKSNFDWDIIYGFIHDVGSYPPTKYHLYDMGGNVMEWTYHDYAPDIYRIKDSSFRGGYNVYDRIVEKEDFASIDLGFRLVRDVNDTKPIKETIKKDSEKSFH